MLSLIDRFVKQSPNCRGPYLASIDFSANLIKRGIQHPNAEESFCVNLAGQFFAKYGRKPIGALDLSYVLPFLIKSEENRLSVRFLFCRYSSCSAPIFTFSSFFPLVNQNSIDFCYYFSAIFAVSLLIYSPFTYDFILNVH